MVQLVWFKRDLRIEDHRPLVAASGAGPVIALYVAEPEYWGLPDTSARQWHFKSECLADLRTRLDTLGVPLTIRVGDAVETIAALHRRFGLTAVHSHDETGNAWTYARDRRVSAFLRDEAIPWQETPQFGVVRGLKSRDGWALHWDRFMAEAITPAPDAVHAVSGLDPGRIPTHGDLGLKDDPCPGRQPGGRGAAHALLHSFLDGRGRGYQRLMSSPVSAAEACSRLSPHLAYGSLSMREVAQAASERLRDMRDLAASERPVEIGALKAFLARLHWHCHFIQKLETEPEIEHREFHPAFAGARPPSGGHPHLDAWAHGRTGFPFVDACMRSLMASGWINFRMRAMLTAFATYHLWLDWRDVGRVLARLFVDYEPGIHWSQIQMQSGTTAINTLRIYNPVKQSRDQDPDGAFIRRHVPELAAVPNTFLHEPWTMPERVQHEVGVVIGRDYPERIVDHVAAARRARERITAVRRSAGFRDEQKRIVDKHGSRRSDPKDRMWKTKSSRDDQLDMGF